MQWYFRRLATALAILLALPAAAVAASAAAAAPADVVPAPADDLQRSFELLSTTYYSKIDSQKLLDGARLALEDAAQKKGLKLSFPAFHDDGKVDGDVDQIASAIDTLQTKTHESATMLTYDAIDGMAKAVGDRWTTFFTPDEYKEFNEALDPDKISGIGVLIQPDETTKFIRAYYVVPGTPAERAGLQSGDELLSVDGKSTKGLTSDDATKLLRGETGTTVHLDVQREGKPVGDLAITRSQVQPPTVIFKMLPQQVGYIWILAFGKDTPDEFALALDRLEKQNVRAFVLDLRDNGGGYVNSALDISSKFIDNDPLLTIEERGDHSTTIDASNDALPRKPMAILVNRNTASASEITAGALQDDGIAVLVGERTYGKGVMQSLTPLSDGAAIKITTAHYLTPKNRDINLKGIVPDFSVTENDDARYGEVNHDAQLQAALNILTKRIADSK